jgi:hypothetical protein
MKPIFFVLVLALSQIICRASELSLSESMPIRYQKDAAENSLRCLETSRGDEERIAKLRNWVAENLSYFGDVPGAISTLRGSQAHYHVPFGCVESAITFLGHGQTSAVRDLLSLSLDLLPYAVGHSAELVQFQVLRIATVVDDPRTIQRAWEAEKLTGANFKPAYESFLQDWQPNIWNMILDRLFPNRHWEALAKNATRDEEIAWKSARAVDYFTGLLLLRQAEASVRAKKSYPPSWIRFVEGGIRAPAINTRPAGLSAELAELALREGRSADSFHLVEETWKLLGGWAPQMSGIYRIERDLAVIISCLQDSGKMRYEAMERIAKRSEILMAHLDPFEQMIQLPVLAEAFYVLGAKEQAQKNWKIATDLCSQNQNPQSQSAGLTRIWLSFARANTWPTKENEALLRRIEKQLPETYSKVNF